jgi:multiple sugar transport system ATP-binding protein
MGRAIVRGHGAYLMDEPLEPRRQAACADAQIQSLQRTLGVTTIYVTHDQTEAMTMGDRIAVMRDGTLQQVDTPERVYQWPANQFVAGFIGSPAMNMVDARLARANGALFVSFGENSLVIDDELIAERPALLAYDGEDVILGIRPRISKMRPLPRGATGAYPRHTCSLREGWIEVLVHSARAHRRQANPSSPGRTLDVRRSCPSTDKRARGAAPPGRRYEAAALLRARARSRDLRAQRMTIAL